MDDRIHVVMAADGPYMKGLEVAKASMVESCSNPSRLDFHLFGEDAALSERIRSEFGTYKGSPMAFLRLYLGELLPEVDWVVYSDVDTIWYRDVIELWGLRDDAMMIQWVRDIPSAQSETSVWQTRLNPDFDSSKYGCSGIMLMNLKRMREVDFVAKAIAFTKENGLFRYVDQDILNALCNKSCGMLPQCWDVMMPEPTTPKECVMHVTGVSRCFEKPYRGRVIQYKYWEHVAKGVPFRKPFALPFCMRGWMAALCFPFAGEFFRDRVCRYLAWRWYLRKYWADGCKDSK